MMGPVVFVTKDGLGLFLQAEGIWQFPVLPTDREFVTVRVRRPDGGMARRDFELCPLVGDACEARSYEFVPMLDAEEGFAWCPVDDPPQPLETMCATVLRTAMEAEEAA